MQKTIYTPAYRTMIERLRDRRRALGLSQREVARRLNIQRSLVAKVEICESRADICLLVRICRLYGLRASKLVRQLEGEIPEGDDPLYLSEVHEILWGFSWDVGVAVTRQDLTVDVQAWPGGFT